MQNGSVSMIVFVSRILTICQPCLSIQVLCTRRRLVRMLRQLQGQQQALVAVCLRRQRLWPVLMGLVVEALDLRVLDPHLGAVAQYMEIVEAARITV